MDGRPIKSIIYRINAKGPLTICGQIVCSLSTKSSKGAEKMNYQELRYYNKLNKNNLLSGIVKAEIRSNVKF